MEYNVSQVYYSDKRAMADVERLLKQEKISMDNNLDYTCAIFDDNYNIIATGSCFGNTLRCIAVNKNYQGEGLLNKVISHLVEMQQIKGNMHLFLYTKIESSNFFKELGFYEIATVDDTLIFMENKVDGFKKYLQKLNEKKVQAEKVAAIIMNANPFTLGHQYLVEQAAEKCDIVHLFVVSEDSSLFPFSVRKALVEKGVEHLKNVYCHDTNAYMISHATFPSYFLKDSIAVIEGHAKLDIAIFLKIVDVLDINCRYVGEEPTSKVTAAYNKIMGEQLPKRGIECVVIERKKNQNMVISASKVREAIHDNDFNKLAMLVPKTTLDFLSRKEAEVIIKNIQKSKDLVHY